MPLRPQAGDGAAAVVVAEAVAPVRRMLPQAPQPQVDEAAVGDEAPAQRERSVRVRSKIRMRRQQPGAAVAGVVVDAAAAPRRRTPPTRFRPIAALNTIDGSP